MMQWTYEAPGASMRLCFTAPQLIVDFGEQGGLTVENDYTITAGAATTRFRGGRELDPAAQATIETFTGQRLVRAWVDGESRLSLVTDRGLVLCASAGGPYESWDLDAPDGAKVICGPGGRLTTFSARD
jgi:hypothetical protein